jgi:hypothetical protein
VQEVKVVVMDIVGELLVITSVLFQEQCPLHLGPTSAFTLEEAGLQGVAANKMPEVVQEAKIHLLVTTEVQVETLDLRAVLVEVGVEEPPLLLILAHLGLWLTVAAEVVEPTTFVMTGTRIQNITGVLLQGPPVDREGNPQAMAAEEEAAAAA